MLTQPRNFMSRVHVINLIERMSVHFWPSILPDLDLVQALADICLHKIKPTSYRVNKVTKVRC